MKFEFNLSVSEIIVSYLLMMAVIVGAGFSGQWLFALLALPLFLRGLIGWCPLKTLLKNSGTTSEGKVVRQDGHRLAA